VNSAEFEEFLYYHKNIYIETPNSNPFKWEWRTLYYFTHNNFRVTVLNMNMNFHHINKNLLGSLILHIICIFDLSSIDILLVTLDEGSL